MPPPHPTQPRTLGRTRTQQQERQQPYQTRFTHFYKYVSPPPPPAATTMKTTPHPLFYLFDVKEMSSISRQGPRVFPRSTFHLFSPAMFVSWSRFSWSADFSVARNSIRISISEQFNDATDTRSPTHTDTHTETQHGREQLAEYLCFRRKISRQLHRRRAHPHHPAEFIRL